MKSITVHRLPLQFDAGQITQGSNEEQAESAIGRMISTYYLLGDSCALKGRRGLLYG